MQICVKKERILTKKVYGSMYAHDSLRENGFWETFALANFAHDDMVAVFSSERAAWFCWTTDGERLYGFSLLPGNLHAH